VRRQMSSTLEQQSRSTLLALQHFLSLLPHALTPQASASVLRSLKKFRQFLRWEIDDILFILPTLTLGVISFPSLSVPSLLPSTPSVPA